MVLKDHRGLSSSEGQGQWGRVGTRLERPGSPNRFRWVPICRQELNVDAVSPEAVNVRVTISRNGAPVGTLISSSFR